MKYDMQLISREELKQKLERTLKQEEGGGV